VTAAEPTIGPPELVALVVVFPGLLGLAVPVHGIGCCR
jgi:hypothetical protein